MSYACAERSIGNANRKSPAFPAMDAKKCPRTEKSVSHIETKIDTEAGDATLAGQTLWLAIVGRMWLNTMLGWGDWHTSSVGKGASFVRDAALCAGNMGKTDEHNQ